TRELMTQEGRVELLRSPERQPLGERDAGEVLGDGAQEPIVDVDRVAHRPQVRYDALDVRQRRAVRQRTTGRLYHLDTEVGDQRVRLRGQPDGRVRVQFERLAVEHGDEGRNQ